ncbi:MAG: NAD(+) synthase [Chloroflexi bacterium]|nr:NAD(+) synthase [Chloroflexota bacterium]
MTHSNPSIQDVVDFLRETFRQHGKRSAVINVSGGIDSAVALTLLTQALEPDSVHAVLLPYRDQSIDDALQVCDHNKIPQENRHIVNIEPLVTAAQSLSLAEDDSVRLGNIMARSRMIVAFDLAKKYDALVCGTENKSEHYLGYFTRFGDAASDIEPISGWYKTRLRQAAAELGISDSIQTKAPSAGLWEAQTDEDELGFTYAVADRILERLVDHEGWDGFTLPPVLPQIEGIPRTIVEQVVHRVLSQAYKRQVPYELD